MKNLPQETNDPRDTAQKLEYQCYLRGLIISMRTESIPQCTEMIYSYSRVAVTKRRGEILINAFRVVSSLKWRVETR